MKISKLMNYLQVSRFLVFSLLNVCLGQEMDDQGVHGSQKGTRGRKTVSSVSMKAMELCKEVKGCGEEVKICQCKIKACLVCGQADIGDVYQALIFT